MSLDIFYDGELELRPVEPTDASLLHVWENNPDLASSNTLIEPMARYQAQQLADLGQSHLASNGYVLFIASIRQGAELIPIGYIELYNYDFYHRRAAVGLMLLPSFRGRGYAQRMVQMIISYAQDLRLNQLYAEVIADNLLGRSFFDRSSFVAVATLPRWFWHGGDYQDLIVYQLCLL